MTVIAADIGGTHARFARLGAPGAALGDEVIYEAAAYPDLVAALRAYGHESGTLYIAAAANPDERGLWRFKNNNSWVIDPAALEAAGWQIGALVNDFEAGAHGAARMPSGGKLYLKTGAAQPEYPVALTGPGTGLGLAYLIPLQGGGTHVLRTKGGHMLAAARSDEQHALLKIVARLRGGETVPVPEDVVSGRGLPYLYQALCVMHGQAPVHQSAAALLAHAADDKMAAATLRLFHEFFGLFLHNVVVTGSAYGGVYLTGGVVQSLHKAGLLDIATIDRFMVLDVAPTVRAMLVRTPVALLDDPYLALRGLAALYGGDRA